MKLKPISIVGIVILIALSSSAIYYWNKQGGFSEVYIQELSDTTYVIDGVYYEGSMRDQAFGELFTVAEQKVDSLAIKGHVAAYYLVSPKKEEMYATKAFVGFLMEDTTQSIGDGFERRRVTFKKALSGNQKASLFVSSVYEDLGLYAEENQMALDTALAVEHYFSQDHFGVDIPYTKSK